MSSVPPASRVRAGSRTFELPVASESVAGPVTESGEAVKVPSRFRAAAVTLSVPPASVTPADVVNEAGLAVVRVPCRRVIAVRLLAPDSRHSLWPCFTSAIGACDDPAIAPA